MKIRNARGLLESCRRASVVLSGRGELYLRDEWAASEGSFVAVAYSRSGAMQPHGIRSTGIRHDAVYVLVKTS